MTFRLQEEAFSSLEMRLPAAWQWRSLNKTYLRG
jgi:hypothetical protein